MQNLVIVDNNINNIQKICEEMSKSISIMKLYNFYCNYTANLKVILFNEEIDIILINVENVGIEIVKDIAYNNINTYKKSIILLYNDIKSLNDIMNSNLEKYVFKCIKLSNNIDMLLKNLSKLAYIKENNYDDLIIESKIKRNLKRIGYDISNCGTKYLIYAIKYLCKNNIEDFKLNEIYLMLSRKFNKSLNTIKGAITKATEKMRKNCDKNIIIEYFNYIELEKMPTITEIISCIYEKI